MEKREPESLIVSEARARGFKQKGNLFVRDAGMLKQLLYVTRSRFQPLFFLDVGIVYGGVEYDPNTPMTWHIDCRADALARVKLGLNMLDIDRSFDADSDAPLEERLSMIRRVFDVAQAQIWGRFQELDDLIRFCKAAPESPIRCDGVFKRFAEGQ